MDLSIITVNWNSVDYLRPCIGSIYENTRGITFEIIVVDNASPDGGVDSLRAEFPDIRIIKAGQNLGFARANNLGFRNSSGVYVLMLNPDTKLVGPALNRLMDAIRVRPDAGIVGARHVNPDLSLQTTSIQRFPSILREMLNIEVLRRRWPGCPLWSLGPLFSADRQPCPVEVIPGACMLLRREVFAQVGMFSEEYFMYAEDIDLNYKVARAGYRNYFVPDATIIHYGGGSSSRQKTNQWAIQMQLRAMDRYYRKTRGPGYAALYRAALGACAVARLLVIAAAGALGGTVWNRKSRGYARDKWMAVLNWAAGLRKRAASGAAEA